MPRNKRRKRHGKSGKNSLMLEDLWDEDSFKTQPEKAGEVLRKMHSSRSDPFGKLDFLSELEDFVAEEPTEAQWDGLFRGGLPQVLMDIALERQLYGQLYIDYELTDYILMVYSSLSSLIYHAVAGPCSNKSHRAGKRSPWEKYVLQQFPRLWSTLVEYPRLLQFEDPEDSEDSEDEDEAESFRDLTADLLASHLHLHQASLGYFPGILSTEAPHIALLCWTSSLSNHMRPRLIMALWATSRLSSTVDVSTFVERAIERGTLNPPLFAARCGIALLNEDLLDHELLNLLYVMGWMFAHPLTKNPEEVPGEDRPLIIMMLCAAQRQVCSGDEERVLDVLRFTFSHLLTMLTKDEETTRVLITREFINYVILLIVRALVPAAKESNISELGDLKRLIQLFGKNAGHVLTEADVNGDDDFTSSVREVWHRAHDDLRALSASVWPQREPVLSWWTDFGRQFGVDVDAPYEPAGEGAYKHPGPILKFKGKGCRWKECLCFGERPHHKLRKCKRCLKVLYCSTKCQKRDWHEGGHKYVCRAPAS